MPDKSILTSAEHQLITRLIASAMVGGGLNRSEQKLCMEMSDKAVNDALRAAIRTSNLCEKHHQFVVLSATMLRLHAVITQNLRELITTMEDELAPELDALRRRTADPG